MPIEFDPYLEWLGIQITERPLDHYALLGLARFESSETLIEVKKEIDPSKIKSNLNSSVVSMGSGSPKSDANQPCEIWIHKIELKALN